MKGGGDHKRREELESRLNLKTWLVVLFNTEAFYDRDWSVLRFSPMAVDPAHGVLPVAAVVTMQQVHEKVIAQVEGAPDFRAYSNQWLLSGWS